MLALHEDLFFSVFVYISVYPLHFPYTFAKRVCTSRFLTSIGHLSYAVGTKCKYTK
jgi:hypothetical protein